MLVNGDLVFEANETFFVNLSNPSGATIADDQGVGTIENDDAAPTLAIDNVSQAEGNAGTTAFTFTVTKTGATQLPSSVDFATADGTATQPSDYQPASGTLSFAAGETSKTITVLVNGDTTAEPDETFHVNLTNASGATIADDQGLGAIENDDAGSALAITDVTALEGNFGTTAFAFTVTKSETGSPASVDFATANGTATAPGDYASSSGTLSFAADETTKTITVFVNGDLTFEADETFFVNLSNASGATIADDQGVGTIVNDDAAPTLSIDDVSKAEGNSGTTAFTFTVTRTGATELPASVDFATANGTATQPGDYASAGGTLSFAPGETTKTLTVLVNGDSVFELSESFFVNLSNPSGATIADDQALGTIVNDDAAPSFSVDDVSKAEGNGGTTEFTFTVTKTGATELSSRVNFETANGTATQPVDYGAPGGTLLFAPGETSKTITVPVNGDTTFEANETFFVNLSNAVDATIGDDQGLGTIVNDDAAPTLSVDDVSKAEGNSGTTAFTFTVTKSGATELPASVDFATANGTATQPSDYAPTNGTLTFAAAETTKTITVLVNGDLVFEANETFFVNLSSPTGATIADDQGLGTIQNDDAAPTLRIDDVARAEGNSGTTAFEFTVTKTGATELPASVQFATANGTAAQPGDYTSASGSLSFDPGETSKTATVLVNGDLTFEANETFLVGLTNASGATIADNQGVGVINNDDAPPALSIDDVSRTEGDSGTTAFTFTVTKTGGTELPASAAFATANGTAAEPDDYAAVGGTVTFAPGEAAKTITVLVNGDLVFEAAETFFVNLSSPTGATIADGQGLGTIANDDPAPTFTIDNVSQAEGDSGTTVFTFTVSKAGATELPATVDFATANGMAAQPGDYASAGGTLTFAPGETSKQVTVLVNGDLVFEASETFFVNLSNPLAATIADAQGLGTIVNDDAAPVLAIADLSQAEGNFGTTAFTFTVTKAGATEVPATVDFATANDTATAPGDYASGSGTLTFAPGETSKQLTVLVNGDLVFEANQTFFVNLTNPSASTIADDQGVGTVENDDAAPVIEIGNASHAEGNSGTTAFTFTLTKTGATELPSTVDFATEDIDATAPSDYAPASGTLEFAPGETSKTLTVLVNGDLVFEEDEAFFVVLTDSSGATIGEDDHGVGTIQNDDAPPAFAIGDVSQAEGSSGTTALIFTVTKAGATALPASVDFATANGTATAPGDYAAGNGTLNFAPGETSKQATVLVSGDLVFEANETFFVNLSNATGATIGDGQGAGTIENDDGAPTLTIDDVTRVEGNFGQTAFTFTVTKAGATELPVTFDYAASNGTATAPSDYVPDSATRQIAPGETERLITIIVNSDAHVRGRRDVLREPLQRVRSDARRRPGSRDDRERRRRADAGDRQRQPVRGPLRHDRVPLHRDQDRCERVAHDSGLHDRRRHGDPAGRLRVGERGAHVRPGRRDEDHLGARERRCRNRAGRDLLRRPVECLGRNDCRRSRHRDDPRRRRQFRARRCKRQRGHRRGRCGRRRRARERHRRRRRRAHDRVVRPGSERDGHPRRREAPVRARRRLPRHRHVLVHDLRRERRQRHGCGHDHRHSGERRSCRGQRLLRHRRGRNAERRRARRARQRLGRRRRSPHDAPRGRP